jgi:hypothetical protein
MKQPNLPEKNSKSVIYCVASALLHIENKIGPYSQKNAGTMVHKGHRIIQICFIFNVLVAKKRQIGVLLSKE